MLRNFLSFLAYLCVVLSLIVVANGGELHHVLGLVGMGAGLFFLLWRTAPHPVPGQWWMMKGVGKVLVTSVYAGRVQFHLSFGPQLECDVETFRRTARPCAQ